MLMCKPLKLAGERQTERGLYSDFVTESCITLLELSIKLRCEDSLNILMYKHLYHTFHMIAGLAAHLSLRDLTLIASKVAGYISIVSSSNVSPGQEALDSLIKIIDSLTDYLEHAGCSERRPIPASLWKRVEDLTSTC